MVYVKLEMPSRKFALTLHCIKPKLKIASAVILAAWIGLAALYGLLKPIKNGCIMTYMYPTYIPISLNDNAASGRYGLYLYHEGWRKIDFKEHLKKLGGVPVLFIPGNAGSYKQVRSLAAESDRAYQGGPFERTFYKEASLLLEEGGIEKDLVDYELPNQYSHRLDWFAVDLEGEHSAMDGRILEEHTEYVVYAIHRILDQYKESHDAREREGAAASWNLPKNVILVGHSMGGFVARAAAIHPHLRKSAVETILTLSSPHQSPPLALQPSLGHYFSRVNWEWRKGYEVQTSPRGNYASDPSLSRVVVVSISGGYNDYQVRSKLESLDGIVPSTHGFMISSTSMKNVWLSMEHQAILWCNQLVVQVSHTLLSLVDSKTGQSFADTRRRLWIFTRMLRSGLAQSFHGMVHLNLSQESPLVSSEDSKGSQKPSACPMDWSDDTLERDLYIQTTTVTILAMDGRRRWLDIQQLGSNGKSHFVFVTNLAPCSGVRLHLWPEKEKSTPDLPVCQRVLEVTSRMVLIPSGPTPRQTEPGSQTEQAPPSAVLWLAPEEMRGFRFFTISVAPRQTLSGRPPPAVSMGVGQFFNPEEGAITISPQSMLLPAYFHKDMFLKEDHPLAYRLSFAISLGLLPVTLSLKTAGCGIKTSGLPDDETRDLDTNRLCKLRCFPPVALAWDSTSGLHVFPNLYSETVIVDSSPALWSYSQGSEKTIVMLLVDPHCSYTASAHVSIPATASRFLLLYGPQIVGFSVAVIFFALMRQVQEWDYNMSLPSLFEAVEYNLRMPFPLLLLAVFPILISLFLSWLMSQPLPPLATFATVSLICYLVANGFIVLLIMASKLVFHVTAIVHSSVKARCQAWERNSFFVFLDRFSKLSSGFLCLKAIRVLKFNTTLVTALVAITLVCLAHPALGLFVLLLSDAFCCHYSMCCFLMASRKKDFPDHEFEANHGTWHSVSKDESILDQNSLEGKKFSRGKDFPEKSFSDVQLEIFNHMHGLLVFLLVVTLMFVPSLVAWLQRIGMGQNFPWFIDSAVCVGIILHGLFNSKPESSILLSFPSILGQEVRPQYIYILAGYYSYFSGLALAPYKVLYAVAAIGYISLALWILRSKNGDKGDSQFRIKNHSHRH